MQSHRMSSLTSIKASACRRGPWAGSPAEGKGPPHFGSGLPAHQPLPHAGIRCPPGCHISDLYQAWIKSGILKFTTCETPKDLSVLGVFQKANKHLFLNFFFHWEIIEGVKIASQDILISFLK